MNNQGDESFTNVLTEYGQTSPSPCNKCVIFPKGKTTWEGFQKPFKDGDVVVSKSESWIGIVKSYNKYDKTYDVYVAFENWKENYINIFVDIKLEFSRLATEEEKEKFFKAIQENGYRWDDETKTLRVVGKLGKLKFKVGDVVQDKEGNKVKITEVVHECGCYLYKTEIANEIGKIYFDEENDWEVVPNKFDITTLKPFDMVLVRQDDELKWVIDFFGFQKEGYYYTTGNRVYVQCIPYEENKHLLGTTNDCDDFYKNW